MLWADVMFVSPVYYTSLLTNIPTNFVIYLPDIAIQYNHCNAIWHWGSCSMFCIAVVPC